MKEPWCNKKLFLEAVGKEMNDRLEAHRRRLLLDMWRDGLGLPTVEQELGWRAILRGAEGGRD